VRAARPVAPQQPTAGAACHQQRAGQLQPTNQLGSSIPCLDGMVQDSVSRDYEPGEAALLQLAADLIGVFGGVDRRHRPSGSAQGSVDIYL